MGHHISRWDLYKVVVLVWGTSSTSTTTAFELGTFVERVNADARTPGEMPGVALAWRGKACPVPDKRVLVLSDLIRNVGFFACCTVTKRVLKKRILRQINFPMREGKHRGFEEYLGSSENGPSPSCFRHEE